MNIKIGQFAQNLIQTNKKRCLALNSGGIYRPDSQTDGKRDRQTGHNVSVRMRVKKIVLRF